MTVAGTALGLAVASCGGWVDALVRRAADVTYGIPFMVGAILMLSVAAGERRHALQIAGTLAALSWPTVARVTRTAASSVLATPFVEAARAAGATRRQLVTRHVVRHCVAPVATIAAPVFGLFVCAEASLSYLGVGLTAPSVSWGRRSPTRRTTSRGHRTWCWCRRRSWGRPSLHSSSSLMRSAIRSTRDCGSETGPSLLRAAPDDPEPCREIGALGTARGGRSRFRRGGRVRGLVGVTAPHCEQRHAQQSDPSLPHPG